MIVLLNGLSRSGKDTAAKVFVEKHSLCHVKISKTVKDVVSAMFGVPPGTLEDDRKDLPIKGHSISPRDMMKFIGTHVGQFEMERLLPGTNRCFWINRLIDRINPQKDYIISDHRYPHEYVALKTAFPDTPVFRVRLKPEFPAFSPPAVMDDTETEMPYDYLLVNKDPKQLQRDIDKLFRNFKIFY
jgi:hypothetical protein